MFSLSDALSQFRGGLEVRVEPSDRPKLEALKEACDRNRDDPLYLQTMDDDGMTRR